MCRNILFAYKTFRWDSEASSKAHVHCVIIGFTHGKSNKTKKIYSSDIKNVIVENINPYLIEGENIFIENRSKPICNVPKIFQLN